MEQWVKTILQFDDNAYTSTEGVLGLLPTKVKRVRLWLYGHYLDAGVRLCPCDEMRLLWHAGLNLKEYDLALYLTRRPFMLLRVLLRPSRISRKSSGKEY